MIKIFTPPILLLLFFIGPLFSETVDIEYVQHNREVRNCVGVLYSSDICITVGHLTNFVNNEPVIIKRNRRAINGNIIYVDSGSDISIIRLENKLEIPTLTFGEEIKVGDEVRVDCFDQSRRMVLNSYAIEPLESKKHFLFIGKRVEAGMSGSPVYDSKGRLISIINGYLHDKEEHSSGCMTIHIKKALENIKNEH